MHIEPSFSPDDTPHLTRAILLYQNGESLSGHGEYYYPSGPSICLATLHSVVFDHKDGRSVITEGQPLTQDAFNLLWSEMNQKPSRGDIIPGSLLYSDDTLLMWWTPSQRRTIYFSTGDLDFNRDVHGKEVLQPALVFKATPGSFSVFALPLNTRPEGDTVLSYAPYCNIYVNGTMCRGDVKLPSLFDVSQIAAWERVFFDSRFTHTNLNSKMMTTHPGGHHALWREMVTTEETVFPARYLTPSKLTVRTLLKGDSK